MSDHIEEIGQINHAYRNALNAYQARTGLAPQTVDTRGNADEREKFAKMDADLTSTELLAQNATLAARLAKLEATPQFAARGVASNDANNPESSAYAQRWLSAAARGDMAEFRALATDTTTNTPIDLERRIVAKLQTASVLRSIAKISTIDSRRVIAVENALPTSALVAEAGAITAADPSFTQVSVTPYKFVCATQMSQEFIEDVVGASGIGSGLQYVADRCAASLGKTLDQYYTVGTGSSQPQGINDTSSTGWASTNTGNIINQGVQLAEDAGATAITGDNIIDCVHAVPAQYRTGNFKMLLSDTALKTIRKIKVNTNDYVWKIGAAADLTGGLPATIYGIPYVVGAHVASTQGATSTTTAVRGNAFVTVGNFDFFEIFDRTGMSSMVDPYTAAASQQSTLYVWMRTDSRIMLPEAFACIYGLNAS